MGTRLYVGNLPYSADEGQIQAFIEQLMLREARAGHLVVRLKGGDPFVFGRGGEEVEALAAAGIRYEIVPGVTAASGCTAYAGIPLTHRAHAQAVTLVTGHLQKDGALELDWPRLAGAHHTVVFYMGLHALPTIVEQLIAHGRAPDTPAALIERGTTAAQRVHAATLAELPQLAAHAGVEPPTLIVVGETVALAGRYAWFAPDAAREPATGTDAS